MIGAVLVGGQLVADLFRREHAAVDVHHVPVGVRLADRRNRGVVVFPKAVERKGDVVVNVAKLVELQDIEHGLQVRREEMLLL